MLRLLFIALIALIVYALVDCVRHDDSEMPVGLPKAVWVVLIVIFPAAGAIAWLVVSRVSRAQPAAGGPSRGSYGPAPYGRNPRPTGRRPVRPVAPDDDPDFLASLDSPSRPAGTPQDAAPDTGRPAPETTGETTDDDASGDVPDDGRAADDGEGPRPGNQGGPAQS